MKNHNYFFAIALIILCLVTSCSEEKGGAKYAYSVSEMAGKTLVINYGTQTRKIVFDQEGRISADYNTWLSAVDQEDFFYDYSKYPSCIYRKYSSGEADTIKLTFEDGRLSKSVLYRCDDGVYEDNYSYHNDKISKIVSFVDGRKSGEMTINWSSGNISSIGYKEDDGFSYEHTYEYSDIFVSSLDPEDRVAILLIQENPEYGFVPLLCLSSAFVTKNLVDEDLFDYDLNNNKMGGYSWRVE